MTVATTTGSCIPGCKASVPRELATEHICVQHFMLGIESACSVMRRESALEGPNTTRKREIESYVKATALKLSDVATGSTRLSDEMKKRVLTTMLTLMNLQESLDRSNSRLLPLRPPQRTLEQIHRRTALAG